MRRRWYDVAALYFPGAVIVDRSAVLAGPAADGSLFLDVGARARAPRPVALPGLTLRPRNGPGPLPDDGEFVDLRIASRARTALENLRPSRARKGVARTLRRDELEQWLDRLAGAGGALRALSHNRAPTPLWRMLDRAQRWGALMSWAPRERVLALMGSTNALVTPERADAEGIRLLDPS